MWRVLCGYSRLRLFGVMLAAALLGVWVFSAPKSAAQWPEQSCAFAHRIPVTISAGASGHNTETRIDLTSANFPADYVFSMSGDDVRVFLADDLTPVDFVVTGWDDVARTATFYVRLPAMGGGASQTISIYLGDNTLPSAGNASIVFPNSGVRLRSRVSTADPVSASDALAAFEAATVDVYDAVRSSVSGINNRAVGGTNGDYGWCISAVLNVTPATSGAWSFRYGADFGRGGHLYVRGQELEQQWNDDLWWANNYANTAETLEGTITLPPGWHRYEALGFEGCCDGPTGFQARAPGGAWQDLTSANFPLRGAQCIVTTASVTIGAAESCTTTLGAQKDVIIDPSSPSPFTVPGAVLRYDLTLSNPGQAVDDGTLVLTDVFPADVALNTTGVDVFVFTDGAVPSGLSFSYGGPADASDSVEFSTDGVDFTYVPSAPVDSSVTHIRFRPAGTLAPNDAGAIPSFSISVLGTVL